MFRLSLSIVFVLFFTHHFFVQATELKPWYPRYLELQPKISYVSQNYNSVATNRGNKARHDHDHFLNLSILGAYDIYSAELETNLAATHHRNFGFADIRLTGRYQFYNDTLGDPASVIAGITLEQVFRLARNDVSNFYQGGIQAEAHVAVGRETECWKFWRSRLWGVGIFGVADIGSPWLRFDFGWEHNGWDIKQVGFYVKSRWGLGDRGLHLKSFQGYGPIQHHSIDLSVEYKHHFEFGGILGVGYGYRVLARNCPRYVNFFMANFLYPFGL